MTEGAYIVSQLGARMHYAVPRILAKADLLERLYTDICAVKGSLQILKIVPNSLRPAPVRRFLARIPKGISPDLITAFNGFGREYAARRTRATTPTEQTAAHLWAGEEFGRRILKEGFGEARGVYCFNSAGLEVLQEAKRKGIQTVMEQTIAPKRIERELLEQEAARFPRWEINKGKDALVTAYIDREEAEWQASDLILCGSEFVLEGIRKCGGPIKKCVVVPYGVDLSEKNQEMRKRVCRIDNRPLRVLTVGAVGLRKGSPYIYEVAKRLKGKAEFRIVGNIGVSRGAEMFLREFVELTGAVPRSEMTTHFDWADVFLLPSVCEGSATVTYEALASGLPVIATPNTGSIIRNGKDGFIVPMGDSQQIIGRLEAIANDSTLLQRLQVNALLRAEDYTVRCYGRRLLHVLTNMQPEIQKTS